MTQMVVFRFFAFFVFLSFYFFVFSFFRLQTSGEAFAQAPGGGWHRQNCPLQGHRFAAKVDDAVLHCAFNVASCSSVEGEQSAG